MFSTRHDKPVNQAFWGVRKCYLVKPTEFRPSLLILKREVTSPALYHPDILWYNTGKDSAHRRAAPQMQRTGGAGHILTVREALL